jgi:hypothetical protein
MVVDLTDLMKRDKKSSEALNTHDFDKQATPLNLRRLRENGKNLQL